MEQRFLHRAKDFRNMAWQALKGVWGIAIVVALVAGLLGGGSPVGVPSMNFNVNITDESTLEEVNDLEEEFALIEQSGDPQDEQLAQYMQSILQASKRSIELHRSPAFRAAVAFGSLVSLVGFIIGGPIKVGYARFRLKVADGRRPLLFKELFSGFDVFGEAFLLQLRVTLRFIGWSLLFVIPGIIALYRYSQVYNVMAEHPELGSGACIEHSKAMMRGNKWRLFCLQFSFIGWNFLSALTLGILALWVSPYMAVAETFFYREVSGTLGAARQANGMYGQPEGYTGGQGYADTGYDIPRYEPPRNAGNNSDDGWTNW